MVAEEHRLRVLEVGVAGHHDAHVLAGDVDEYAAQGVVTLDEVGAELLGVQPDVGRYLVVAGAAGVQARARGADVAREGTFDGHVDILVVDVPGKLAALDLAGDVGQARVDGGLVLIGDDALLGEHARVRAAARDVLLGHRLVDLEGRAELLREGVDALLEPTTPKRHAPSLCLLAKSSQLDYLTAAGAATRGNGAATSVARRQATGPSGLAATLLAAPVAIGAAAALLANNVQV